VLAHRHAVRVYYEDTDFSGVVYHARYLHFLERGRTEMLRSRGIDQASFFAPADGPPLALVVAHLSIDFHKPARMDDLLDIETTVLGLGGASLMLEQRALRNKELLCTARVKIAALAGGRVARLPRAITAALSPAATPPAPALLPDRL
jgi:acyl-CoA thioester hydrolase